MSKQVKFGTEFCLFQTKPFTLINQFNSDTTTTGNKIMQRFHKDHQKRKLVLFPVFKTVQNFWRRKQIQNLIGVE